MSSSFVGGKLKLKGGIDPAGIKKKKKKKQPKESALEENPVDTTLAVKTHATERSVPPTFSTLSTSPHDEAAAHEEPSKTQKEEKEDRRTEAEKRFEAHLRKYEEQRLKQAASKSHRERVKEMNEKLATLTEHHDLPRISYSYM